MYYFFVNRVIFVLNILCWSGPPTGPPQKNDAAYFERIQHEYEDSMKGNKFLNIPEALNVVMTRTISLLTMDVKTYELIGVSREVIEEALKSFKIALKILAKWSNVR